MKSRATRNIQIEKPAEPCVAEGCWRGSSVRRQDDSQEEGEEGREEKTREMNETVLAITRKVVLCAGLLVAATLFAYPHWSLAIETERGPLTYDQDLGRAFILSPPAMAAQGFSVPRMGGIRPIFRINYTRHYRSRGRDAVHIRTDASASSAITD